VEVSLLNRKKANQHTVLAIWFKIFTTINYLCPAMAKLFIVGFPKDMQEIELVELFSAYGRVNTITIVTDKDSGESKGYGFITMTDQPGADRAIAAMDGAEIDERKISVRIAEDKRPPTPEPSRKPLQKPYPLKVGSAQREMDPAPTKKKRSRRS
jgi:RNA recognition motif-containing protein